MVTQSTETRTRRSHSGRRRRNAQDIAATSGGAIDERGQSGPRCIPGGLTPTARLSLSASGWLGRYRVTLEIGAVAVLIFTLLRLVLLFGFADWKTLSLGELAQLAFVGLRFDLLTALIFLLPQILHLTLFSNRFVNGRLSRGMLDFEAAFAFLFLPFVSIAEVLFFDEFQSQFNYIAFEYLVYPTEVFGNIWQSYPVVPLLSGVAVVGAVLFLVLRRRANDLLQVALPWRRRYGILLGVLAGIGTLWSTTGMASMAISENRVANQCAGNGMYSFVYYAWTCQVEYGAFYQTIDKAKAYPRLRQRITAGDVFHNGSSNPMDRTVIAARGRRDYNVVLILEESLGSDFIGALGDRRGLSPRFDRLTQEGLLFDNFYATGNRTARALEAVLTSIPPIPSESILKRSHSDHVYTLANVLADRGYRRLFVEGGRGIFDGKSRFALANGYERFVEWRDFKHPLFTTAWGVCDEDIFSRALAECESLHQGGQPFFMTILSTSNHRPYTYPEGRIDLPSAAQTRDNAVKYADWALGDFFAQARKHAFYENTLFVVLGDHGARVYGSQLFPMQSYRIPVLMILPHGERKATRCHTLASSLDIAPTIMGILGGSYRSVFFGRDALNIDPKSGYALMQHNHDVALLESSHRILVLGFQKKATMFRLNKTTYQLTRLDVPDADLRADAISIFQTAYELYSSEKWFPDAQSDTRNGLRSSRRERRDQSR